MGRKAAQSERVKGTSRQQFRSAGAIRAQASMWYEGTGVTQEIRIYEEVRRADAECHSLRWVEEGLHPRVAQHEVSQSKHDEIILVEWQLNSGYHQAR